MIGIMVPPPAAPQAARPSATGRLVLKTLETIAMAGTYVKPSPERIQSASFFEQELGSPTDANAHALCEHNLPEAMSKAEHEPSENYQAAADAQQRPGVPAIVE